MREITFYSNGVLTFPPYTVIVASEYAAPPVHCKERRYTKWKILEMGHRLA
jgi:hypothetical protein